MIRTIRIIKPIRLFSHVGPTPSVIDCAFEEARSVWDEGKRSKSAELEMINAEIKRIESTESESEILKELNLERLKIISELSDKNLDLETYQKYATGKIQVFPLRKLDEMSNSLYHKHNGPILMSQMANYYHLFTDVLPLHWKPLLLNPQVLNLSVKFSGDFLAQRGNLIMPENTIEKPLINFTDDSKEQNFYTLFMIDADTPNIQSKTMTSIPLHLISNISKSSSLSDDSGEIIIPYIPPHPTRGTGFHRYIHVLFSHSKPSNTSLLKANLEKYKWDVKKFFHSEEFDSLNWNPRAMAFHRASWSPIVSEIYERGLVKIPANLRVDGKNENQAINDGWLNVKDEPIFGLPVKRSWKSVNRRLYRYAFK